MIVDDDNESVAGEVVDHPHKAIEGAVLGQVAVAGGVAREDWPGDGLREGGLAGDHPCIGVDNAVGNVGLHRRRDWDLGAHQCPCRPEEKI